MIGHQLRYISANQALSWVTLYTSITDQAARLGLVLRSFQLPPSPPRSGLRFHAIRSGTKPTSRGRTRSPGWICQEKTARIFSLAMSRIMRHRKRLLPGIPRPGLVAGEPAPGHRRRDGVIFHRTARRSPVTVERFDEATATRVCSGVASGLLTFFGCSSQR